MDPSYSFLLKRRKALNGSRARIEDPGLCEEFERLAEICGKDTGYEFARRHGIATPIYQVFESAEDAMRNADLDAFVLKPRRAHSSRGVYLLRAREDGRFFCHMHNKIMSREEVVEDYRRARRTFGLGNVSKAVILEEYIKDSRGFDVPLDYKVYAFYMGTPIVMQRYAPAHLPKEKWGFQFYDREARPLGLIRIGTKSDPAIDLRPPVDFDRILEVAAALARYARVSFVRADLYSTERGVLLGECTKVPNDAAERFEPEYDRLLARNWADSLAELGLDYRKR